MKDHVHIQLVLVNSLLFCHTEYYFISFSLSPSFLSHSHSPRLSEHNPEYPPKITFCSLSHPLFQTVHVMTVTTVMEDGVTVDMCKTGRRGSPKVTYVLQRPQTGKGWQRYRSHEVQRTLIGICFKCAITFVKPIVQRVHRES